MTRTVRKLNDTRYHLDNEVNACKQRIIALKSTNIELIRWLTLQNKSHNLDTQHHNRLNKQTIIRKEWDELKKWNSLFPKRQYSLPTHLIQKIRQEAPKISTIK